jgi:integrase
VYLPPLIFGDVLAHLDSRVGPFPDNLLFKAPTGPERHLKQSLIWKSWRKAREAAGRPDCPWHSLRHFAGTRHAETGATFKDTMAFLGHSTASAAMRYQHETGRAAELARLMK